MEVTYKTGNGDPLLFGAGAVVASVFQCVCVAVDAGDDLVAKKDLASREISAAAGKAAEAAHRGDFVAKARHDNDAARFASLQDVCRVYDALRKTVEDPDCRILKWLVRRPLRPGRAGVIETPDPVVFSAISRSTGAWATATITGWQQ